MMTVMQRLATNDIDRAVNSAIDAGMSAREFLGQARDCWDAALRERTRWDHETFNKAIAAATK